MSAARPRTAPSATPAPKKAVVALVEREGRARSLHVANVTAKNVRPLVVSNVDRASYLMTDESMVYERMGREFSGARHRQSQRQANMSAPALSTTTNTVENFFSIFKRGVIGTYHHMSEAHLHRYCREFDFRYNTRKIGDAERTDAAIIGARGKRLTYRRPTLAA